MTPDVRRSARRGPGHPTLAVIVPATDDAFHLDYCLAALEEAASDEDQLLVVRAVDSPRLPPSTQLVTHLARSAPAEARNAGATMTEADVLVFVDADVSVAPDCLDRIRATFAARPELDAVFGAYDDNVTSAGTVSAFRNLLHHHVHHRAAGRATTFWTGLGAIRRETFTSVGGLDERLRFLEDLELGARLREAGAVVELDPALSGTHLKRYTLRQMLRTDLFGRGVPWVRLILAGRASSNALNAGPLHRLSAIFVWATIAGAISNRRRLAAASALAFLGLNRDFHALLQRRLGWWRGAVAGPLLHALHLAVASLAVPLGIWGHLRGHDSPQAGLEPIAVEPLAQPIEADHEAVEARRGSS